MNRKIALYIFDHLALISSHSNFLFYFALTGIALYSLKSLIMKSHKRTSKNSSVRLYPVGVRKRKNGKFCAEIKHPFNKRMIWLGTFDTANEASKSYKSKKLEFEELVMAKSAKMGQILKKPDQESSSSDESEQNSSMGVADNTNSSNGVEEKNNLFVGEEQESLMSYSENSNSSNKVEEKCKLFVREEEIGNESDEELFKGTWVKISNDEEVKFSYKLGVPIVDNYGYLLGEFSVLDDLTVYV